MGRRKNCPLNYKYAFRLHLNKIWTITSAYFSLTTASEHQCLNRRCRTLFLGAEIFFLAGMGQHRRGRLVLCDWKELAFYTISSRGATTQGLLIPRITLGLNLGASLSTQEAPRLGKEALNKLGALGDESMARDTELPNSEDRLSHCVLEHCIKGCCVSLQESGSHFIKLFFSNSGLFWAELTVVLAFLNLIPFSSCSQSSLAETLDSTGSLDPQRSDMIYTIEDVPPWYLCIFLGLQVRCPLYDVTTDIWIVHLDVFLIQWWFLFIGDFIINCSFKSGEWVLLTSIW